MRSNRLRSKPQGLADGTEDRAEALSLVPELATILPQLDVYEELLRKWQPTINLVSSSTLASLWTRHFADSAQLPGLVPKARRWLDLGSGAGFPGLIVALLLPSDAGVVLVESDKRKAAFLREVSRETKARAEVVVARLETLAPSQMDCDVVCARGLAPIEHLLDLARSALTAGAVGLFPEGQDAGAPNPSVASHFSINYERSRVRPDSRIAIVRANRAMTGADAGMQA